MRYCTAILYNDGTQDTLIEDLGMATVYFWAGGRFKTHTRATAVLRRVHRDEWQAQLHHQLARSIGRDATNHHGAGATQHTAQQQLYTNERRRRHRLVRLVSIGILIGTGLLIPTP